MAQHVDPNLEKPLQSKAFSLPATFVDAWDDVDASGAQPGLFVRFQVERYRGTGDVCVMLVQQNDLSDAPADSLELYAILSAPCPKAPRLTNRRQFYLDWSEENDHLVTHLLERGMLRDVAIYVDHDATDGLTVAELAEDTIAAADIDAFMSKAHLA